jgi:hypothetical protein
MTLPDGSAFPRWESSCDDTFAARHPPGDKRPFGKLSFERKQSLSRQGARSDSVECLSLNNFGRSLSTNPEEE